MVKKKDSLAHYRSKRNFKTSPEPEKSSQKNNAKKLIFVIQKHDASHLHYDLRLQHGKVLLSWAVPKGPPKKIGEKRLAVQTEDHPLTYAHFAGTIPQGEYGGGTVEIWDYGTYQNIKEKNGKKVAMKTCLQEGHIEVQLDGTKLRGAYALIRTNFGDGKSWLLLKMHKKEK